MGWNNGYNNNGYRNNRGNRNNNYGRNGGYGGNDRGYNDDRGYGRGYGNDRGYRDGYDQNQPRNFLYDVGQRCILRNYPDVIVSVIRQGREQYECRLPDLTTQWFFEHELAPYEEKDA